MRSIVVLRPHPQVPAVLFSPSEHRIECLLTLTHSLMHSHTPSVCLSLPVWVQATWLLQAELENSSDHDRHRTIHALLTDINWCATTEITLLAALRCTCTQRPLHVSFPLPPPTHTCTHTHTHTHTHTISLSRVVASAVLHDTAFVLLSCCGPLSHSSQSLEAQVPRSSLCKLRGTSVLDRHTLLPANSGIPAHHSLTIFIFNLESV